MQEQEHEVGDVVETPEGPAEVIALSETREGLIDAMEELQSQYRVILYADKSARDIDRMIGSYDKLEEAKEKIRSIGYDLDATDWFYIRHEGETVWGDPEAHRRSEAEADLYEAGFTLDEIDDILGERE